jgi:hypothetical protein
MNLIKRQGKLDTFRQEGKNPDYMATSPHAAYDANRNKRMLEDKFNQRYDLVHNHEKENDMILNDSNK